MKCIWCKEAERPSAVEHIIPEALGCPDGFVLTDGSVCERCNNSLAHLDQAVIGEFDIFTYLSGVPRKRGRPPEIRSRGNVIATTKGREKELSINMERHSVHADDGSILGAFGKSDRNIKASITREGSLGKVSFSVPIGQNPKFVRGIVKIAFSSLAYFVGANIVLAEDFDVIRRFVKEGKGKRFVLLKQTSDARYHNEAWPPYKSQSGEYAVVFRLANIEFCVDLSPTLSLFPVLKNKATEMCGSSGWTYLPLG